MINPPIEEILSWPQPNYVDPETRGPALAAINHTFLGLCVVLVAARIYTRVRIVRWFGWDDVLIIVALVRSIASRSHECHIRLGQSPANLRQSQVLSIGVNVGTEIGSSRYGWGRHVWDIEIPWIVRKKSHVVSSDIVWDIVWY